MSVPRVNFVVDQGANTTISVNVRDANNSIIDLTGYTAHSSMRKSSTTSTSYTIDVNISPTLGIVTLSLSGNAAASIPEGRYHYDCLVMDSSGVRSKIVEGMVTVKPGATRWP